MSAITTCSTSFSQYHDHSYSKSLLQISKFALSFVLNPLKPSYRASSRSKPRSLSCSAAKLSRYDPEKFRKGADILVESLERQGVETVFAYPRCASMHIHHSLERSSSIRNIKSHNQEGALFAAEGYARSSGKPGICIALSAANLVSGLADTMLEGVPLVAITGQLPRQVIYGEETPTHWMEKHKHLVIMEAKDIPRIIEEAFFLATSGRRGLVMVDFPVDVQRELVIPNWESQWDQILSLILASKKPVLHVGSGCLNSIDELNRFVQLTGIPVTSALMGLGSYPCNDDFSLQTFGMQRTLYANHALEKSDLLLALGFGSDDTLPSKTNTVHIGIDSSAEIGIHHVSVCVDVKSALREMNNILEERAEELKLDFELWRNELNEFKQHSLLSFKTPEEAIPPQYVIQLLHELTDGNAVISTGTGQLQMWAAQFYKCSKPMHWLASRGFGEEGFGLSAAIGASLANPNEIVVYIDGDRSFLMNLPELPTIVKENVPVKILILNNQYLSDKKAFPGEKLALPNMLQFAEACGIPARSVSRREEVRGAIQTMLETPGPCMLDVIIPQQREIAE